MLPYVVRIWMYVTPVMYAINEIPDSVRPLLMINPLYPYFYMLEAVFKAQWPEPVYFLWGGAWAVVAMVGRDHHLPAEGA